MRHGITPPIFFLRHQKENAPRPVEEKKRFGGSVCASADLLPPAGEGARSQGFAPSDHAEREQHPPRGPIPGERSAPCLDEETS